MKKHFSHNHAVKLTKSKPNADEDDQIICSVCEQSIVCATMYSCIGRNCYFFLHEACFDLPREITKHESHTLHPLVLLSEPISYYFLCDACGEQINGFSFCCEKCEFGIHVKCFSLPKTVECKAHEHALRLRYSIESPAEGLDMNLCNVCGGYVEDNRWCYYCKDCNFCTDLICAFSPVVSQQEDEEKEEETEGCDETVLSGKLKHFSHPHELKVYDELLQRDENEVECICSGCWVTLSANDSVYTCTKPDCEFFLHKSCFELPRKLEHKSHPDHALKLLSKPPRHSLFYDCSACGCVIDGFSFACEKGDEFRLHVKCALIPESVVSKAHKHVDLVVQYSTPKSTVDGSYCGVCDGYFNEDTWSYCCKECDFITHIACAESDSPYAGQEEEKEEKDEDDDGEESDQLKLLKARIQMNDHMARLEFQLKMSQDHAKFMMNLGNSLSNL